MKKRSLVFVVVGLVLAMVIIWVANGSTIDPNRVDRSQMIKVDPPQMLLPENLEAQVPLGEVGNDVILPEDLAGEIEQAL